MDKIIEVRNLTKIYKIPKKQKELSFFKRRVSWLYREWVDKIGVYDLNFDVFKGEILGYLGENGSGKSTTIKILTSVLHQTKGEVNIYLDGKIFNPIKTRIAYTKNIGVVFGQRSILSYDIPVRDSFKLFKEIYGLSKEFYEERLNFLNKLLGVEKFLEQPYRTLSLGEKMRCELVASFLHRPKIVFLDEPTIGLDSYAKIEIRKFLKAINKRENTTIILTTHDMDDIEELCERIIFIENGRKVYDGTLCDFKKKYLDKKIIEVFYEKILDKKKLENFL